MSVAVVSLVLYEGFYLQPSWLTAYIKASSEQEMFQSEHVNDACGLLEVLEIMFPPEM